MMDGTQANGAGIPAHERVYRRMRELVLFGDLAPGQPVTINGLRERLDAGTTPVREALRRLTAEGALSFQDNRRIVVPVLDAGTLSELSFARESLEPELARRAAERALPADVDRLRAMDTRLDGAIERGDVYGYLLENYRFHADLNTVATAPVLAELVDNLWLRFGPALRVVCGQFGTRGLPDMHKAILAALSDRDGAGAAEAMLADVKQGMEIIARALDRR